MNTDAWLKEILDNAVAAWADLLGLPVDGPLEPFQPNVPVTEFQPDRVFVVKGDPEWLLHFEVQWTRDHDLPERVFRYNALVTFARKLATLSVIVLLRPDAEIARLRQPLRWETPFGRRTAELDALVVRVWEIPARRFLDGELHLIPLATLANLGDTPLAAVLSEIVHRIETEASPAQSSNLALATYTLAGVRFTAPVVDPIWQGVRTMRESSTYQAIVAQAQREGYDKGIQEGIEKGIQEGIEKGIQEGIEKGEALGRLHAYREALRLIAGNRLGEPDPASLARLNTMNDVARLEQVALRVLNAQNWRELLGDQ